MNEKILHLILAMEMRTNEKFVIQTRNPNEKVLEYIMSGNLNRAYQNEIRERKKINYPPFKTFIKVSF